MRFKKQPKGFNLERFKNKFFYSGLLFFLGWVIITLVLGSTGLAQQSVTVTVLIHAPEAIEWQPTIAQFKQKYPKINLKIVEGPNQSNQIEDLYTSSFLLGNSPYDLVFLDTVWTYKFAAAGWLRDISDRISKEELAKFLSTEIEAGRYQGKLYRIPLRSDVGMLYYRTDLLAQGGYNPPETFADLMEISKALQKQGLADLGYLWQGKQYEGLAAMFVEILQGYGAFWIAPDTKEVGLDRPEAIRAVKFLRSTIEEGVSPPGVTTYTEEETRLLFQNGRAIFLRNWPYVYGFASQDNSPIQGKFAIKPMVHAPGYQSGACQGGWGLGIATTSKHPDEAWKVIEFFSSEDVQRQFILSTGKVPSRTVLFNDPAIVAKYPHYPELLKVLDQAVLRPPIPQYAQASDILQRYLSAALTDELSPEQAMQLAAAETRRLFGTGVQ